MNILDFLLSPESMKIWATGILLGIVNAFLAYLFSRTLKSKIEELKTLKELEQLASNDAEKKDLRILAVFKMHDLIMTDNRMYVAKTMLTWFYQIVSTCIMTVVGWIALFSELDSPIGQKLSTAEVIGGLIVFSLVVMFTIWGMIFTCLYRLAFLFQRKRYANNIANLASVTNDSLLRYFNSPTLSVDKPKRFMLFLPFKTNQEVTWSNFKLVIKKQYKFSIKDVLNISINVLIHLFLLGLSFVLTFISFAIAISWNRWDIPTLITVFIMAVVYEVYIIGRALTVRSRRGTFEKIRNSLP